MNNENYFKITENAKNYPEQPWKESGDNDYLMYAVPSEDGMELMTMYEAMAFISSNGPASMIAVKLPVEEMLMLEDPEIAENYKLKMKPEFFIDYYGDIVI